MEPENLVIEQLKAIRSGIEANTEAIVTMQENLGQRLEANGQRIEANTEAILGMAKRLSAVEDTARVAPPA